MQLVNLAAQLWSDDCGAIITAEYMMLGSVLTLGTVQGLATLRDSANQELHDMGSTIRETRQYYSPQLPRTQPKQVNSTPEQCPGGVCP